MIVWLILTVLAAHDGPQLNGGQFMALLETAHSDIADFEMICEGEVRCCQAQPKPVKDDRGDPGQFRFQARYVYRADGNSLIDSYQKPFDDRVPWMHEVQTLTGQSLASRMELPDSKRGKQRPPYVTKGSPSSLEFAGSPVRFIYLPLWRGLKYSISSVEFECEGWEDIDGNPVVRVVINHNPRMKAANKFWSRYWIDLERGGHVLRCDSYLGSNLRTRVRDVALARISTKNGKHVWIPVDGVFESFVRGELVNDNVEPRYTADPMYREIYHVVPGSILINRGLDDKAFTSAWKKENRSESNHLLKAAKEFDEATRKATAAPAPPILTDSVGFQEHLEKQLAEANLQAKQLDASPPERRGWDPNSLIRGGLAVLAISAFVAAFIMRWRAS